MLKFERYNSAAQNALTDILNGTITGTVIENSISAQEISVFKNVIAQLKEIFFHDLNRSNGYSLPGMFGQLHKTQPKELIENYFQNIEPFCSAVNQTAKFDVMVWLKNKLQKYFAPYPTEILPEFLPYSFRVVFPKRTGLFIHQDGKLLPFIHEEVSEKISGKILPETMMSWYFTLQESENGGELWVADSAYSNYEKDGQFDLISSDGKKLSADDIHHIKVKTPTASLLMFKGGSYWHKVIPPSDNSSERITLGGFMALDKNRNNIFFWS